MLLGLVSGLCLDTLLPAAPAARCLSSPDHVDWPTDVLQQELRFAASPGRARRRERTLNLFTDGSMPDTKTTAIIIVDHGSRRAASNEMLEVATKNFADQSEHEIVEPAHMELAQPDIATAFRRCVERGAKHVVVFPYFLSPGRHWNEDIPALVKAAAAPFAEVSWLVTAPFGLHPDISAIIADRIQHCEGVVRGNAAECDVCQTGQAACLKNSDSNFP